MTRHHARAIAVALVVLGVLGSRTASAQFFIEPELGARGFTTNWKKIPLGSGSPGFTFTLDGPILGPAVTLGGIGGFHVSPNLAIVGTANVGVHTHPGDVDIRFSSPGGSGTFAQRVVESGLSFEITGGGRIYPLAGNEGSPAQPYVGVGLGLVSMGWKYNGGGPVNGEDNDAVGGLLVSGEGGLELKMSHLLRLGAFGRLGYVRWSKESVEGLDTSNLAGMSWDLGGRLGLHF